MTVPRSSATATRLSVRQLADLPIWILRTTAGRPLNSVLITGPDGLILVNTGTTNRHGAALCREISNLTSEPLTTIVYPHHPSTNCQGTAAVTDRDSAESGNVVILATGRRGARQYPGIPPNLLIDRECVLELSGVTMRLFPVGTGTVNGTNIYLPKHRVALLTDEPCMYAHTIGRPDAGTPFARAVNWFLRFPVEHVLGSHMLPLSGVEVHLVLKTYLNRTPLTKTGRKQDD